MSSAGKDDWDRLWQSYAGSASDNPAQRYRREIVFSLLRLEEHAGQARVLDIGSGQGDFAAALHARYPAAEILGLEVSDAGVAIASRKVPAARFVRRDLRVRDEPAAGLGGWATHAVCAEVLEHLDEPMSFLTNVLPYLGRACRVVVTVPGGPMSAFDRHIGHRRHFRPSQLRRLLEGAGLRVDRARGVGFPFFNLYRLVVLLRGRRLVADVAADGDGSSRLARAVMKTFGVLFALNPPALPGGWQTVATARTPAA